MSDADIAAIRKLLATQFRALQWAPGKSADWDAFRSTFFPDTTFVPAARPARRQTIEAFIERMRGLEAEGKLKTFAETMLGTTVHVFGNVAVALGACEMLENGTEISRDVGAFLLIKDAGEWKIAGQAWDLERETSPIPEPLQRPDGD
ncbi:MAG TPA: nuclear transport factor 2 family protein [Xanthobacteraceae bacterium]